MIPNSGVLFFAATLPLTIEVGFVSQITSESLHPNFNHQIISEGTYNTHLIQGRALPFEAQKVMKSTQELLRSCSLNCRRHLLSHPSFTKSISLCRTCGNLWAHLSQEMSSGQQQFLNSELHIPIGIIACFNRIQIELQIATLFTFN